MTELSDLMRSHGILRTRVKRNQYLIVGRALEEFLQTHIMAFSYQVFQGLNVFDKEMREAKRDFDLLGIYQNWVKFYFGGNPKFEHKYFRDVLIEIGTAKFPDADPYVTCKPVNGYARRLGNNHVFYIDYDAVKTFIERWVHLREHQGKKKIFYLHDLVCFDSLNRKRE